MSQTPPSPETLKSSPISASTNVTSPEQPPQHTDNNGNNDDDDDIWASDTDHNHQADLTTANESAQNPVHHEMLSDLPTIRRQHMTSGYREGLSVGKAKVMQTGFDEGYPIGLEIALRAGKVLGVLEGYVAGLREGGGKGGSGSGSGGGGVDGEVEGVKETRTRVEKMLARAKEELAVAELLKGLDDEEVARMDGVNGRIEEVVVRWEAEVFGTSAGQG